MKYNELSLKKNRQARRDGRGISAGRGKTAGRGTKGQKSRAGSSRRPGFEGGQNPLMQRLPKLRGFRSHRDKMELVFTGDLDALKGNVTNESLANIGLLTSPYTEAKLISRGEIKGKHVVELQAVSKEALKVLQKSGGSFKQVARQGRKARA
jgi:large subunit ribosomal protein L15